jgi:hypothetical protein
MPKNADTFFIIFSRESTTPILAQARNLLTFTFPGRIGKRILNRYFYAVRIFGVQKVLPLLKSG